MSDACCAPDEQNRNNLINTPPSSINPSKEVAVAMSNVKGGWFSMGSDNKNVFPGDGEGPVRDIFVDDFDISTFSVSVKEFSDFIDQTSYSTDAEKYGWSFVFFDQLESGHFDESVQGAPWWIKVENAYWNKPDGSTKAIESIPNHPVTHVSWNDANAYCEWSNTRLPTEAEWEYAARGGLKQNIFPWGDEFLVDGELSCNIFQGNFPNENNDPEETRFTVPVDFYKPNKYGLYNMVGNVWEWTQDWFSRYHDLEINVNPRGPDKGSTKVIKGGSFLCHDSYCNRYRVSARTSNSVDSSTSNMGFRVIKN